MKTYGLDRFGALIARQCAMAAHPRRTDYRDAATRIVDAGNVERRLLPVSGRPIEVNAELAIELQERGIAVPSTTRVGGKLALRMNVMNHRTTQADLDAALAGVLAVRAELLGRSTA